VIGGLSVKKEKHVRKGAREASGRSREKADRVFQPRIVLLSGDVTIMRQGN